MHSDISTYLFCYISSVLLEGSAFENVGQNCLRFYYNMNGFHTGTLRMFVNSGSGREIQWSNTGDQYQEWKQISLDLNINNPTEVYIIMCYLYHIISLSFCLTFLFCCKQFNVLYVNGSVFNFIPLFCRLMGLGYWNVLTLYK